MQQHPGLYISPYGFLQADNFIFTFILFQTEGAFNKFIESLVCDFALSFVTPSFFTADCRIASLVVNFTLFYPHPP
jgi:hypothetical protein